MNDDEQNEGQEPTPGSFEALISGIETEMNAERLQKQGAHAITAARIAGAVIADGMASGVPYELAKEMGADTWNILMGLAPVEYQAVEGEG